MYLGGFKTLLIFYFSYLVFSTFSRTLLPQQFSHLGFSFKEITLGYILFFSGQLIGLLIFRKMMTRTAWYLALIIWMIFIFLVPRITSIAQFLPLMIFAGFNMFFFWVFYNIAHFELTPQQKRGESTAFMVGIPSIIVIIMSFLAGLVAQINMNLIWIFAFPAFLLNLYLIHFQKNLRVEYRIIEAIKTVRSTSSLVFWEGVWEAMIFGIIPIYTLFFISTPADYGTFIAYLALMGAISNLLLGRFTDKIQKRSIFLYPVTILLAIVTFLFPIAVKNLQVWTILAGSISFLLPLFWNLIIAIIADTHSNLKLAFPGREIFLTSGRITGLTLVFLSFTFEKSPKIIFFVLGSAILLLPITLYWNTKIKKNYSYL